MATQTVLEGDVQTNVDHVHCFSCRQVVTIGAVLDAWSDFAVRDLCPRCGDSLFCTRPRVVHLP
jgi:NAD-dependent SIR2 family protein deacetylase